MLTKVKFTKMVEEEVRSSGLSYMDTVVYLCEKNNIEIEDIKKFISPVIAGKIEVEAEKLNFLPKSNSVPLE